MQQSLETTEVRPQNFGGFLPVYFLKFSCFVLDSHMQLGYVCLCVISAFLIGVQFFIICNVISFTLILYFLVFILPILIIIPPKKPSCTSEQIICSKQAFASHNSLHIMQNTNLNFLFNSLLLLEDISIRENHQDRMGCNEALLKSVILRRDSAQSFGCQLYSIILR